MAPKQHPHRRRRRQDLGPAIAVALALASGLALVPSARAMDATVGFEAGACEFPSVVSLGGRCTGTYVGHGLVVTAAHCSDDVTPGVSRAYFGEDIAEPALAPIIERCVRHPDGDFESNALGQDSYAGVDLGFCVLDDADELPDLPLIPPMVPAGCERDWLAQQVEGTTAVVTAVGFGCSGAYEGESSCGQGVKRHVPLQLVEQISYTGSPTKLRLERVGAEETGLMDGDSGGPVLARLPDGTWRLVAVYHGPNAAVPGAFLESVAPYLHWIEAESEADVTPCHDFVAGVWVANDACTDGVPVGASEIGGAWSDSCRSPVAAGTIGVVGGLCAAMGSDEKTAADSVSAVAWLPRDVFVDAARTMLAAPEPRRLDKAHEVALEFESLQVFPFLVDELPEMLPVRALLDPATLRKLGLPG